MQQFLNGSSLDSSAKIYGYIRVSTNKQANDGESLQTQQERISAYCEFRWGNERAIQFFIEEGESAYKKKSLQREAFGSLVKSAKRGDVIVCTRLDRVFRNTHDALDTAEILRSKGISLHLMDLNGDVTTNGLSSFFFTILAALSQHESALKSDRISEVKGSMKARGIYSGGKIEFGFKVIDEGGKGTVSVNDGQYMVLLKIKEYKDMRSEQAGRKYSIDFIANRLKKEFGDVYTISRSTLGRLLASGKNEVEARLERINRSI